MRGFKATAKTTWRRLLCRALGHRWVTMQETDLATRDWCQRCHVGGWWLKP